MKKNQTEILSYINSLKGYQGYIQMSDKSTIDVWCDFGDISFAPESGFVYEAHFFNGTDSIAIRQINDCWLVSTTDISKQLEEKAKNKDWPDIQTCHAIGDLQVKMAQIWESVEDEFCEGMKVLKLKKVVFAGFVNG